MGSVVEFESDLTWKVFQIRERIERNGADRRIALTDRFKCGQCNKIFRYKRNLKVHMKEENFQKEKLSIKKIKSLLEPRGDIPFIS